MRLLRNADRLLVVEPVDRMGERCQVLTDPRGPISEVVDAGICAFFLGEGTVDQPVASSTPAALSTAARLARLCVLSLKLT